MHQLATQWIVGLLRDRNIPFQICGGLAAKGYGAERALNDIDLFVPGEHFLTVVQAGQAYISKPAAHRCEEGWDLTYVQFKYAGIKVEGMTLQDYIFGNEVRSFDMGPQSSPSNEGLFAAQRMPPTPRYLIST